MKKSELKAIIKECIRKEMKMNEAYASGTSVVITKGKYKGRTVTIDRKKTGGETYFARIDGKFVDLTPDMISKK